MPVPGYANIPHLALLARSFCLLHGSPGCQQLLEVLHVLDGVHEPDVHMVRPQPAEAGLQGLTRTLRIALVDLRAQQELVAPGRNRPADLLLAVPVAVIGGRLDVVPARVQVSVEYRFHVPLRHVEQVISPRPEHAHPLTGPPQGSHLQDYRLPAGIAATSRLTRHRQPRVRPATAGSCEAREG